jgi:hypothetical protein
VSDLSSETNELAEALATDPRKALEHGVEKFIGSK